MRTACPREASSNLADLSIFAFASSMFRTSMLSANILGIFCPRFTKPDCSSALIAVLIRVSMSSIESSQPAALAISSADWDTDACSLVMPLIAFQICWISFWVSLVWFSLMKFLFRSSSENSMQHSALMFSSRPARPASCK